MSDENFQNLGSRTFWFLIIKRSSVAFVFLLIAILLLAAKSFWGDLVFIVQYNSVFNTVALVGFIAAVFALAIGVLASWLEYLRFKFMIDKDAFKITRGVLTKETIALPYRCIKSVDLKQSLFYQIFGVSRVTIETVIDVGQQGDNKRDFDDEVLPVMDHDLALIIQEELTKKANVQKMNIPY